MIAPQTRNRLPGMLVAVVAGLLVAVGFAQLAAASTAVVSDPRSTTGGAYDYDQSLLLSSQHGGPAPGPAVRAQAEDTRDASVVVSGFGVAANGLPEALTVGKNAEEGVHVYTGVRNGKDVYAGITNNMSRRQLQHGDRFVLQQMIEDGVTRGEARAIEQGLIVRNPGFENKINSISPNQPYYQQAVDWGESWLQGHGF